MCVDTYILNCLTVKFQKHQTMKNKDCQISVFHKLDSIHVPVVKEN